MNTLEEIAWQLYCKETWTHIAADFWKDVPTAAKTYYLEQARLIVAHGNI